MAGFNMDDYVDVAQRIQEFYERYPDGRLTSGSPPQLMFVGERSFIVYHARAFRAADDPQPGDGWAWEPVPGPTQFTRDSELQNAETAAWGRAIVALGFATKKIASRQEVQNRTAAADTPAQNAQPAAAHLISDAQRRRLFALAKEADVGNDDLKTLIFQVTAQGSTNHIPVDKYDELCALLEAQRVPF
jgi:hypothetical protein